MRESEIERYLKAQLEPHGFLYYKFTSPANAGVPDRIIVADGAVIFCELKRPGQKIRPLQRYQHDLIRAQNVPVIVVDSYESADALIASLKKGG